MQSQGGLVISENAPLQQVRPEQDPAPETDSEPHYYANPELLAERCRQLAEIPFVLVEPEPRSEASKKQVQVLEEEFRNALKRGQNPILELQSTVLGGPLIGGWPKIESEESDIDYPLAETEEEWFVWKQKMDEKRARKRQKASGSSNNVGASAPAGSNKPLQRPNDTMTTRTPQVFSEADGKENEKMRAHRFSTAVAPEADWNEFSIERAPQSTPVRWEGGLVPTPQAPARHLISPLPQKYQSYPRTPFDDLHSPKLSQKNQQARTGKAKETHGQPSQPSNNNDRLQRPTKPFSLPTVSQESPLITTMSPYFKRMPSASLMSPSNGIMSRESVDSWRKCTVLPDPQEEEHGSRSPRLYSQGHVPSPTTTYYLYGSQNSQPPPPQQTRSSSYSRELEEELERERQIFDLDKAVNGYNISRDGTWNLGSLEEDTEFRSQSARDISRFVENDLGDPYGDKPYAALDLGYNHYQDNGY